MKQRRPSLLLELASGLLTPMAFVGFIRIFEQTSDVVPLMLVAIFSTVIAVGLRRMHVPLPLSALASALVFSIFAMNRFAGETLQLFVIPTGDTFEAGRQLWLELNDGFKELVAPVPATESFLLPSMAVAWVMAFLTDWGALRLRLAFEPVLPASLVFIFASVLGTQQNRVFVSSIFVVAVLIWAVAQRSTNLSENNLWLAGQRSRGASAIAVGGAIVGVLAIISGIILGPALPGANGEPKVEINEGAKPVRDVESPIVDIAQQLGPEQRENVVFTVRANSERYWRTAGLDTYKYDQNGNSAKWIIEGKFKSAGDGKTLSGESSSTETKDTVVQTFNLTSATNIWVPAAYEPTKITDQTAKITWNEGSDSLTVSNDVPSTANLSYTVESNAPRFTPDQLRQADETVSDEIAAQYLALPENIPERVIQEARDVTGDATNRYDKMIALQNYFRTYDYSLERPPPIPGLDPLEDFIVQRIGFCQQFAGTFAVMARALGHPARVATGYTWGTPGEADADGFRTYTVRGRQAHAWPEVYFGDLGWVIFEPTPGRGAPGSDHTGVEAVQDNSVPENAVPPGTESTLPSPAESPAATPPTTTPASDSSSSVSSNSDSGSGIPDIPFPPVWVWLPLLTIAAYVGAIPLIRKLRRQRRLEVATSAETSPSKAVAIAWGEATDAFAFSFNLNRRPSETKTEFARRSQSDQRIDSQQFAKLADLATASQYHPNGVTRQESATAVELSTKLADNAYLSLPKTTYWARVLNPARVLARFGQILKSVTADSKHIEQISLTAAGRNS